MQDFKYVGLDILTQAASTRRYSFLFFYLNWLIIRKFYLNLHYETSDLATHASKTFKASNKKHIRAPKRTNQKNEPQKERPEARTQRTTKSTNHEKNDQKHEQKNEPRKERPKSTSQKAQTQPRCFKPASQPRCFKPASQSHKAQQAPLIASLRPRTQSSPYRSHVS